MKNLAEQVKYVRGLREWTQAQLAAASGVSTSTIGNIEADLRLARGNIPQIAEALGVNFKWLSEGVGDMDIPKVEPDLIAQEMESLRALYENVPPETREQALFASMRAMAKFLPRSYPPSVEPQQPAPAGTPSSTPQLLPAVHKTP